MDINLVFLLILAAGIIYGFIRMNSVMSDSTSGNDFTRLECGTNRYGSPSVFSGSTDYDFKATHLMIVCVAIGGLMWLLSGNFATPLGAPPAITGTVNPARTSYSRARSNMRFSVYNWLVDFAKTH